MRLPLSIREILKQKPKHPIKLYGYVKTSRILKQKSFIEICDGSTLESLHAIAPTVLLKNPIPNGTSVEFYGDLVAAENRKQEFEFKVRKVEILGTAANYPLHKGRIPIPVLRQNMHLRGRTALFGAIWRVRSELLFSMHQWFRQNGFINTNPPILTSNDCEGGGEAFSVASTNADFFPNTSYLTVSSQLHLEMLSHALNRVYTIGPCFRAEPSDSTRHLAEFWMAEAELFCTDLEMLLYVVEQQIKSSLIFVLENCYSELQLFDQHIHPGLIDTLKSFSENSFKQVTYDDAVKILVDSKQTFQFDPVQSLQTEHEKYLAEKVFKGPVFITHYPISQKPFYCKEKDGKAQCMDLIMPNWGEIVGGSLRESDSSVLEARIASAGMRKEDYEWYLDLRRYGSVPHGGYGLGIERLLGVTTGMSNIRDLIPVPRYLGSCKQ